jgi:hypothetical protein
MSAVHFYARRRIPGLPREHINLVNSRYGITFVDLARHWDGLRHSVLSVVASRTWPLRDRDDDEIGNLIRKEMLEYLPHLRNDLRDTAVQAHFTEPLFVNTIGSWQLRPRAVTKIDNLFMAGDYCQTEADLATMESAVISGINAAAAVLGRAGKRHRVAPLAIGSPNLAALRLAKYAALPLITPLGIWRRLGAELDGFWRPQPDE